MTQEEINYYIEKYTTPQVKYMIIDRVVGTIMTFTTKRGYKEALLEVMESYAHDDYKVRKYDYNDYICIIELGVSQDENNYYF